MQGGPLLPPGPPPPFPGAGATVSVGRDSWVGEVMYNVGGFDRENVPAEANKANLRNVTKHTNNKTSESRTVCEQHVNPPPLENNLADRIREKKRLFHSHRNLELKNLPDGVTEQDIRAAFPDLSLTSITVERNDGRYRAGAKLQLSQPELLDEWPKSRENVFVKNKEVSVCVGSSDQWVCIARLPLNLSDDQFQSLVAAYGKVKSSFLMISERTGESKGYGLVKYFSNEAAAQARHLLDGRDVRGFTIQADWLNSTHISFRSLHSKCLYVDHIPHNYRDMTEFRNQFSVIKKPPYCQIALRNGVIQDWGLVEFFDSGEAELTQEEMNGHSLSPGHKIRVHYCIPGVNAINIYMKVVNAPIDNKKKALLEDTPSSSVYNQLQKLADQNPAFAQNLQNIIQTQIQTIQTGISPEDTRGSTNCVATSQSESLQPKQTRAPTPSQQQQIDSNAQAALMILLTAQRQAQAGEASLLHNPEVVNVLQSLVCQEQAEAVQDPYAQIMNIPGITMALGQSQNGLAGSIGVGNGSWTSQKTAERQQTHHTVTMGSSGPTSKSPPPIIANNLNLLSNTQSLNQLLGVIAGPDECTDQSTSKASITQSQQINTVPSISQSSAPSSINQRTNTQVSKPSLLGESPYMTPANCNQRVTNPSISAQQLHLLHAQQTGQQQQLLQAQLQAANQLQLNQQLAANQYYSNLYSGMSQVSPQSAYLLQSIPGISVAGSPHVGPFLVPQAIPQPITGLQIPPQSSILNTMGLQQPPLLASQPLTISDSNAVYSQNAINIIPPPTSPISTISRPSTPGGSTSFLSPTSSLSSTPSGLKRKASIPPSPEQSPQGAYIGQHSQGLGGHYADSYWQKKRVKHN